MRKTRRISLGPWRPDLPPLRNQGGVKDVNNVVPTLGGWARAPVSNQSSTGAMAGEPRGAFRGQFSDGTSIVLAATSEKIYRLDDATVWQDVTRASGDYAPTYSDTWSADQFGDAIFFCNRANPLQAFDTSSSLLFEDVGDAPRAAHLAVAENFLWLGDLVTDDGGVQRDAVAWSGINAPFTWPDPFSNEATAVLSGRQVLEGNGGTIHEIISGSEVVAIFQENAIHRADFVGNDIVWQFSRVITDHGMMIPHAGVAFERQIFYLARDGFRVFNYTTSQNIGKDVINDWFFDDWDQDNASTLTMARDPNETRIYIGYTSNDAAAGEPDTLLIWDYALNQWSKVKGLDAYWQLSEAGPLEPSLDSPDAPPGDPDQIGGDPTETDPPGDQSFDDLSSDSLKVYVGHLNSGLFQAEISDNRATSNGDIITSDMELAPGRRALLTSARPQYEGDFGSQVVNYASTSRSADMTDSPSWSPNVSEDTDGGFYFRDDGRFHQLRLRMSNWDSVAEVDVEFQPTGTR